MPSSLHSRSRRYKVVVTNWVHDDVLDFLAARFSVDANRRREPWPEWELRQRAGDAEALMAFMPDRVDNRFLAACPDLRIVAGALKGYDNFDVEACTERGVWLTIVPDLLTEPTAELAVGLTIALARNVMAGDRYVRDGQFEGWRPLFYGTGLAGATVGIVGMGAVGRAIAERLRGFKTETVYYDRQPLPAAAEKELGVRAVSFNEALARSDFVILALPLVQETTQIIGRDALKRMKPGSYLVNPARGSLVHEEAVADALETGRLAGYAADVFEMEDWARTGRPDIVSFRLQQYRDRTVLTPHLGSPVDGVRRDIAMEAAMSIVDCFEGRRPRGAVNAPPDAAMALVGQAAGASC
jgi:phosphonate dehydrogenase